MKKSVKIVVTSLILVTIICLSMAVGFAAANKQEVTAWIKYDLKMMLNGELFEPTETDGTALRPLTYNNRTYLPVNALGTALNVAIGWDAETQTVFIGENDKFTDFIKIVSGVDDSTWKYSENKELLYAGGKTFNRGLILQKDFTYAYMPWLKFNTNQKYSKMGFTVATDSKHDLVFDVKGNNGEVLKTITVSKGTQEVEFDIIGHQKIYFEVPYSFYSREVKPDANIVFGDIYFK